MILRILLSSLAALVLGASAAGAAGIDLSFVSCPGDPGATRSATLNCAGGTATSVFVVFAPNEAISDLVAFDTIIDFFLQGSGNISTSSANFWDFGGAHATGVALSAPRPAAACGDYTDTWNDPNNGTGFAALIRSPQNERIAAGAYRNTNLAVARNQQLFGFRITMNTAGAVEGGGALGGCRITTVMAMVQGIPESNAGSPTTVLTRTSAGQVPTVTLNDTPVPAARHTWAQLKSLYR